tara:strand:- start:108 stop:431 length:324 start_codon:yes stop_codon:yes gene_type:complete
MSSTRRQKIARVAMLRRRADDLKREQSFVSCNGVMRPGFASRLAMKKWVPDDAGYPSKVSVGAINVSKPGKKIYTGDVVLGIATMHKSNAVPVISQQEAQEIARMSQ